MHSPPMLDDARARADRRLLPEGTSSRQVGALLEGCRRRPYRPVLAAYAVIVIMTAIGRAGEGLYLASTVLAVASAIVGVRAHRPEIRWPWIAMGLSAITWTVSGVVATVLGGADDLTRDRSLWSDAFALPGYLFVAVALVGLVRVRRSEREHAVLLDAIMIATGAMLGLLHVLVIPVADVDGAWLPAQVLVVAYPVLTTAMLVAVGRLLFASGGRSVAFLLLLSGVLALHTGDVLYALASVGRFELSPAIGDTLYAVAPACFAAAALHPGMRGIARRHVASGQELGVARVVTVITALSLPTAILAASVSSGWDVVTVGLCLTLTAAAVVRVIVAMRDQARATDRTYYRATHDDLTGLPGRSLLNERLDDLVDDPDVESVTLQFVDLDRFKRVNDTVGHQVGDQVLVSVAERVVEVLRVDDSVYRVAGDEFVVLLPGATDDEARSIASRIRERIRVPFTVGEVEVFVSASIGYASTAANDTGRVGELLREADEAMYRSKERGRDATTRFDVSMREHTERRIDIERKLRRALEERELSVHFQPIVSGGTWALAGFEALARWIRDDEVIRPDEFIPVAEESGMIVPLGKYVLDTACAQLAAWRREHPEMAHCTMSVNVSSRQIRSGEIVDAVADVLERHGLPGDALWLEITESLLIEDTVTTVAVLNAIRALGVRLSVDDFGTGYSSLSYLKRFPVSRVKIDRAFVNGMCHDESDRSLVSAVVAMASALGLDTVAEGVETPEQALTLRDFSCEGLQGYLFGRPLPPAEVPGHFAVGCALGPGAA